MSSGITWEDPPPISRGGVPDILTDWPAVAAELRAHPGRWGWVPAASVRSAASVAHTIAAGRNKAMCDAGPMQATARLGRVYVRYVGPGSTSPEPGPAADACREMPPSTTPGECPAHGFHPHNGMTCLDCPACWELRGEAWLPSGRSTEDGAGGGDTGER